jgi:hypothetical protein
MDLVSLIEKMDAACAPECRCDVLYWMPVDFEVPENIESGLRYQNSVGYVSYINFKNKSDRFYYEPFKDYSNIKAFEDHDTFTKIKIKKHLEAKQREYFIANKIV